MLGPVELNNILETAEALLSREMSDTDRKNISKELLSRVPVSAYGSPTIVDFVRKRIVELGEKTSEPVPPKRAPARAPRKKAGTQGAKARAAKASE